MKRARQQHQKRERREAILAAGLALLNEGAFQQITMTQVAERAGLVKGTLYLYFATREELFLELLRNQLHGWFWDLEAGLEILPRRGRVGAAARLVARATSARSSFRTLLGACRGMLEPNLPAATARTFHQELRARVEAVGPSLERALPFLRKGQGAEALLQLLALAAGWQALPVLQEPAPDPEPMADAEMPSAFQTGVELLLIGWRERNRRGTAGSQLPEASPLP